MIYETQTCMIKSLVKLRVESCSDSVYGVFENVIGVTAQSPCEYLNKYPKLHAISCALDALNFLIIYN